MTSHVDSRYIYVGPLAVPQYAHFLRLIRESDIFEIPNETSNGRLSHICLKHTGEAVGFLGDEELKRVVDNGKKHPYYDWRLKRMYKKAIRETSKSK
jgi:hypothetical protein